MRQPASNSTDPRLIAAVHQAGGECRIVVARLDGPRPTLVEARTTQRPDDVASILDGHGVGRVIRVLPASRVICRTCALPDADGEHLAQALRLQAEAHMLASVPPHRVGMAVLDAAVGETTRTGLILSWPESSGLEAIAGLEDADHAPEIAALAALMNGDRPASPLLSVDRSNGAVAIALTHSNGATFRATHESGPVDGWPDGIKRIAVETALNVGHTPAFAGTLLDGCRPRLSSLGGAAAASYLPAETIAATADRFDGVPTDADWFETYGIALGAVLAASGSLEGLCGLRAHAQLARPSVAERLTTSLSRPRTAAAVIVMCIIALGIVPVAAAGLRLTILSMRHNDLDERLEAVENMEAQLAMFDALEAQSWSMTKVLSDIMCATPEGIELDSVRINTGDGSFNVTGIALKHKGEDGDAIINKMVNHLSETRVFDKVSFGWSPPKNLGQFEFTMSAKIARPHMRPDLPIERDFGRWTYRMRRDGEGPPTGEALADAGEVDTGEEPIRVAEADTDGGAAPITDPSPDTGEPVDSEGSGRPRTTHRPEGAGGAGTGESMATARDREANVEIPTPLTADQIAIMSEAEVKARLPINSKARNTAKRAGDDLTNEQLKEEFQLLLRRLKELSDD